MRGENIINIYIQNSVEYRREELNEAQLAYIYKIADKQKYNELRQSILFEKGDDVKTVINILFPNQDKIEAYNK